MLIYKQFYNYRQAKFNIQKSENVFIINNLQAK